MSIVGVKKPPPEERFKNNVIEMMSFCEDILKELIRRGYQDIPSPDLIKFGGGVILKMDDHFIIEGFIVKSLSHWDKIKAKDESFFIDHSTEIFSKVPVEIIKTFVELFRLKDKNGMHVVSKENRDVIWAFFESFVKISINYIHNRRMPILVDKEEKVSKENEPERYIIVSTPKYKTNYMNSTINLRKISEKWGIVLKFENKV